MVWKIGPERVAQQKKLVSTKTMNSGEVTAWRTVMLALGVSAAWLIWGCSGGQRNSSDTKIVTPATSLDRIVNTICQS